MIESVRARLALWHTATLAILLLAFATASYVFLERTMQGRMDQYLEDAATAFGTELMAERADVASNDRAAIEAASELRFRDLRIVIFDSALHQVAATPPPVPGRHGQPTSHDDRRDGASRGQPRDSVSLARLLRAPASRWPALLTLPGVAGDARVYATPLHLGTERYVIAAVQSMYGQRETMAVVRRVYLIAIPLALLLAGLGGYVLARRSLAPVVAMSSHAARIGAANLHERLPVTNPRDELGQLARVFNDLLARIAGAFEQQRSFMADASHELRTPVAIMRGEADIALSREERPPGEYRDALAVIADEGRRLSLVVDDLLLLARADAGQARLRCSELYLDELVVDCARAMRSLAAQRRIDVRLMPSSECPYRGDEELLRRVVLNLLDNAIKYSPAGATVCVALERADTSYRIAVRDTGPGVPPDAQSRLFERFYRVDRARARTAASETGGAGLGLAIGRVVAEAHGGRLELVRATDRGSEFALVLPRPSV